MATESLKQIESPIQSDIESRIHRMDQAKRAEALFVPEDWLFSTDGLISSKSRKFVEKTRYLSSEDQWEVGKALVIGDYYHRSPKKEKDKSRGTGEPYYTHPIAVAEILADLKVDADTLKVGLLHDTFENTNISAFFVKDVLGNEVVKSIDTVTKVTGLRSDALLKLLENLSDARGVLVKFADRLHNVRTYEGLNSKKQEEIARETIQFYYPLAEACGLTDWADEMLERSSFVLWPELSVRIKKTQDEFISSKSPQVLSQYSALSYVEDMLKDKIGDFHLNALKPRFGNFIKGTHGDQPEYQEPTSRPFNIIVSGEDVLDYLIKKFSIFSQGGIKKLGEGYAAIRQFRIGNTVMDYEIYTAEEYLKSKATIAHLCSSYIDDRLTDLQNIISLNLIKPGLTDYAREKVDKLVAYIDQETDGTYGGAVERDMFLQNFQDGLSHARELAREPFIKALDKDGVEVHLPNGSSMLDFAFRIHTDIGLKAMHALVNGNKVPFATIVSPEDKVEIITDEKWTVSMRNLNACNLRINQRYMRNALLRIVTSKDLEDGQVFDQETEELCRKTGFSPDEFIKYKEKEKQLAHEEGVIKLTTIFKNINKREPFIDISKAWKNFQRKSQYKYITYDSFLERCGIDLVSIDDMELFVGDVNQYENNLLKFEIEVPNHQGVLALLTTVLSPLLDIQTIEFNYNLPEINRGRVQLILRSENLAYPIKKIRQIIKNLEENFFSDKEAESLDSQKPLDIILPIINDKSIRIILTLAEAFGFEIMEFKRTTNEDGTENGIFSFRPAVSSYKPITADYIQELVNKMKKVT